MTCWIGVDRKDSRTIVRLAGELSGAHVPELLLACEPARGPVELDLTDLVSADAAGIDALLRVRRQGVLLVRTPGYIRLKMDSADGDPHRSVPPEDRYRR